MKFRCCFKKCKYTHESLYAILKHMQLEHNVVIGKNVFSTTNEYYNGMFGSLKHNILLMLSQIEGNLEYADAGAIKKIKKDLRFIKGRVDKISDVQDSKPKPKTMHEEYEDGSDHEVCKDCGFCKTCNDCENLGCIDDSVCECGHHTNEHSHPYPIKLDFDDGGYMTIKKFDYEDNQKYLKRINKILKILLKDVKENKGVTE